MNSGTRKLVTSVALIGTAALLGACSSSIDAAKVESAISEGLAEQTGLIVDNVTCPESEPIEADASFDCQVALGDQTFSAVVVQDDNEGNIRWNAQEGLQSLKGLIDNESLEAQITEGVLQQANIEVQTDCGPLFRVARAGESFTCTAVDLQNNEQEVTVNVKDDNGNVSWEL